MKFLKISLLKVFALFFVLLTVNTIKQDVQATKKDEKPLKLTTKPLDTNFMRLFNLGREYDIFLRAKFIWTDKTKADTHAINKFDDKVIKIGNEMITVYTIDPNNPVITAESVNASKYLMSIKLQNLDLPCNDYYFLCSLGGFINTHSAKLKKLDFSINKKVEDTLTAVKAKDQCIVLTIGTFHSLQNVGYICFESVPDFVYFYDLLSEKVLTKASGIYDGLIQMVNENGTDASCSGGLQTAILALHQDHLIYHNGKEVGTKNYKEYLKIPYKDIYGYGHIIKGIDKVEWNGDPKKKPSAKRCFTFKAELMGKLSPLYFCVFRKRADWSQEGAVLTPTEAFYVNELWIEMFNYKLHQYNLKVAQEITLRSVSKIDLFAHTMEPIKYEFRTNYLIYKLKVKQLIKIKKIDLKTGEKLLEISKEKLMTNACISVQLCIKALKVSMKKGLLPLKYKGYAIAWTLQNPYVVEIPVSGIEVRSYPRNSIGLEIVKMAESLIGLKKTQGNIVLDVSKYKDTKKLGSAYALRISSNTFHVLFKRAGIKFRTTLQALKYCTEEKVPYMKLLLRKIQLLTLANVGDPFYELLGFIRDMQLIKK